jgi:hypothetical protein
LRKNKGGDKGLAEAAKDAKKGVVGERHKQFTRISEMTRLLDDMLKAIHHGIHFLQSRGSAKRKPNQRIGQALLNSHGQQNMRGFQ